MAESHDAARRLQQALEMYDFGIELVRLNLRRAHPEADEREIARLLRDWREHPPGAEAGDAEGRPIEWPPPHRRRAS